MALRYVKLQINKVAGMFLFVIMKLWEKLVDCGLPSWNLTIDVYIFKRMEHMFPEYRDLISKLKQEDAHFARLFDEHNELDDKITGLENDPVTSVSAENEIDALKVKKLALKDQLYEILKKADAK